MKKFICDNCGFDAKAGNSLRTGLGRHRAELATTAGECLDLCESCETAVNEALCNSRAYPVEIKDNNDV